MSFTKEDVLNLVRIFKSEFLTINNYNKVTSRICYGHYKVLDRFIDVLRNKNNINLNNLDIMIKEIQNKLKEDLCEIYSQIYNYQILFKILDIFSINQTNELYYDTKKIIFLLNYNNSYIELIGYKFDNFDLTNIKYNTFNIPLLKILDEYILYEYIK